MHQQSGDEAPFRGAAALFELDPLRAVRLEASLRRNHALKTLLVSTLDELVASLVGHTVGVVVVGALPNEIRAEAVRIARRAAVPVIAIATDDAMEVEALAVR